MPNIAISKWIGVHGDEFMFHFSIITGPSTRNMHIDFLHLSNLTRFDLSVGKCICRGKGEQEPRNNLIQKIKIILGESDYRLVFR